MKLNYILLVVLFFTLSCSKDDERLIASEITIGDKFLFPEGTPYDETITDINDKFNVKIIYKGVTSDDVNQILIGNFYTISNLPDTSEEKTINFVNNHIFRFLKPELTTKVFRPYLYLVYDLRTPAGNTYAPDKFHNYDGMYAWTFCFEGRKYGTYTAAKFPQTETEIKKSRGVILFRIFRKMVEKEAITVPEEFFGNDFDYQKEILIKKGTEDSTNYFMKRGFIGNNTLTSFDFTTASYSVKNEGPTETFVKYMMFIARYSRKELEDGLKLENGVYKNYPKVMKYYDFVDNYMIQNYDFDLKKIQTL